MLFGSRSVFLTESASRVVRNMRMYKDFNFCDIIWNLVDAEIINVLKNNFVFRWSSIRNTRLINRWDSTTNRHVGNITL